MDVRKGHPYCYARNCKNFFILELVLEVSIVEKGLKKSAALILIFIIVISVITGCGMNEKDAKAYVQATLDANYKGIFKEYIKITDSTEKEAKEMYKNNMDTVMSSFVADDSITEDVSEKYKELFQEIYAKANYTIGKVEKTGEGFDVEVQAMQLQVFDGIEDELVEITKKEVGKSKEQLSEEEIDTIAYETLYDLLSEKVKDPIYGNEQTIIVRVVKDSDGIWMISDSDLTEIDKALFR